MLKIRNAAGDLGVLIDGGWTAINPIYAPKSTRQGILTNEQKEVRAAKNKRHAQNKARRAAENRERNARAGKKG